MIISHEHRFIFIKTRKTAGTSIEISLSRYCGDGDVITPISLGDEPLRGVFGMSAQNYLSQSDGSDRSVRRRPLRRALLRAVSRVELLRPESFPYRVRRSVCNYESAGRLQREGHFYNHMTSAEVIRLIGVETWNSYFRFCFEREPLSKVISDYRYRAGGRTFDEYLRDFPLPVDYDKYYVGGVQSVDFLGRHESLVDDLTAALRTVGIAFDGWLPRAKAIGSRSDTTELTAGHRQEIEVRMRQGYEAARRRSTETTDLG